jgi:hypothetical protein
MTTLIDGKLAQARRMYHHIVHGGTIKRRDVACLVEALELAQGEIETLTRQNTVLVDIISITSELGNEVDGDD